MTSVCNPSVLQIHGAGFTHVGCVRERNEDAILLDPSGQLWVVADGMGGHGHGDVAATMVVDGLAMMEDGPEPQLMLQDQIFRVNADIYANAVVRNSNMGATVAAAYLQDDVSYLAWVGDSRIYLWRGGVLRQLSRDHSIVQEMIDDGLIAEDDAFTHPERNVITRAVGTGPTVEVDFVTLPLLAGDYIMMCSDGLTGCVRDAEIAQIMAAHPDYEQAAAALVRAALDEGAPDNVSVIVVTAQDG